MIPLGGLVACDYDGETVGTSRPSWMRPRFVAALALLFAITLAVGLLPAQPAGEARTLAAGWQYRWTEPDDLAPLDDAWDAPGWTAIDLPAHPARGAAPMLWLRTRIPEGRSRDPAIAIDAVIAPFEAYVGRARVHQSPRGEGIATRLPGGVPWQVITLPEAPGGETFALRIRADGATALVRGTPLYGDRADHLAWTLRRDVPRLACGLVIVVLGLAGLVVVARRDDWKVPVGYAVWTISIGLYTVVYTHAKDVLVDWPRLWFVVWAIVMPLIPVGSLLFTDGLFGTGPRGFLARSFRVVASYVAFLELVYLGCTVLYAFDARASALIFTVTTNILRVGIAVTSVAVAAVVARRARAGNVEARIFIVGFFVLFALALNDILAALGVAALSWKSLVHYGALAQTLAFALILQRRYAGALERAAAAAAAILVREREKERLLRDLHDGVGGLTSNIRVLAELGQKGGERAQRSLTTIAELSSKSLAELRAFVQALDDTTTTWETLAAELRRFGTQLVSAAGIELEMKTEISVKLSPPGLLSLHVLRVFQESLTNALKQRAARIDVILRVDAEEVEFVVRSTAGEASPGGEAPRGIDLGRGLGNMRARAAEVGGTFELLPGPTTTARFHVPLPLKVALPEKPPDPGAGVGIALEG